MMERRTGIVALNAPQVAALVSAVMPGADVASFSLLPGGLSNTNYMVRLAHPRATCVLRLYVRKSEVCWKEVALAELLAPDVPVPVVMGWSQGGVAGVQQPFALFEFRHGQDLASVAHSASSDELGSAARSIGRALALIGRRVFDAPGDIVADAPPSGRRVEPFVRVEPFEWSGEGLLGYFRWCLFETRAAERLGATIRDQLWAFVQREAERWTPELDQPRLVHGDFNPSNILLTRRQGACEVAGILDWEYANSGSVYMDLGNLLRRRDDCPLPASFADAVVGELATGGIPVHSDWRARAAFIDLTSACEFLASEADRPETHRLAQLRIRRTLAAAPSKW